MPPWEKEIKVQVTSLENLTKNKLGWNESWQQDTLIIKLQWLNATKAVLKPFQS